MAKKETNEKIAKAYGSALPISTKVSIEICNFIRGKNLNKSIALLKRVLELKEAVPYKRFDNDIGHKPGIGAGRYPQKASTHIIRLLESVKANAQAKNLDTDNLKIIFLVANKGSRPWRYGRQRRRKAKRTHIIIHVEEIIEEKKGKKVEIKKPEVKKDIQQKEKIEINKTETKKPEVKDEKSSTKVKEEPKVENQIPKKIEKPVEKAKEEIKKENTEEKPTIEDKKE